jgi:hypothetical protein
VGIPNQYLGRDSASHPRIRFQGGLIRQVKDWESAEYLFLSISHTLGTDERKEYAMNTIVLAVILMLRVVIPLLILLSIGEWIRRRDANYWTRM